MGGVHASPSESAASARDSGGEEARPARSGSGPGAATRAPLPSPTPSRLSPHPLSSPPRPATPPSRPRSAPSALSLPFPFAPTAWSRDRNLSEAPVATKSNYRLRSEGASVKDGKWRAAGAADEGD